MPPEIFFGIYYNVEKKINYVEFLSNNFEEVGIKLG